MPRPGKAGSKAERDSLRQEMLVGGCSLELIATEMERRWGFRPREAYRHAHGWSQDEVAARFTEVADRLGGDRGGDARSMPAQAPMIGTRIGEYERWPHAGRRPSPYVLTVLAAVLGTTVERLLDYDDHRKMPDQERTVLAAVLAAANPPATLVPGTTTGSDRLQFGRLPATGPLQARVADLRGRPMRPDGGVEPGAPDVRPDERYGEDLAGDHSAVGYAGEGYPGDGPHGRDHRQVDGRGDAQSGAHGGAHGGPGGPGGAHGEARSDARTGTDSDAHSSARPGDQDRPDQERADTGLETWVHPPQLQLPQRVPRAVPRPLPESPLIAVALDPAAPDAASAARRHRRDRLLAGAGHDARTASLRSDEEVIMDAAGQSAEFGEWAEGTNVGATTLEQLDDDVRRIARDYLNNAPLPLMLATLRVRNRVFTLLEGRQHPHQTRHLYLAAGRLCGLLAWMTGDLGRHAEAETQARTGWLCAELAGADGLRAWIRATQSKVAYWDGRIQESAKLAGDGMRFAASDTARVLLASLSARAWARLGDAGEAHTWLGHAQDERAKAGEDEVGGLLGFSEAQQSYLAGTTHLWLREPAEALRSSDRAVWLYDVGNQDERFYGAEMLALVDAATALVQSGDLDGAAERLRPVLELPPDQRLETFVQRLGEMRETLRRSRYAISKPAVDMQRQIEDFRSGALGQYLSR